MRSLFITTAVVTVAIALCGCRQHRQQPLPGPQSLATSGTAAGAALHREVSTVRHECARAAKLSCVPGTLEAAFARRPCAAAHPQFRHSRAASLLQSAAVG